MSTAMGVAPLTDRAMLVSRMTGRMGPIGGDPDRWGRLEPAWDGERG